MTINQIKIQEKTMNNQLMMAAMSLALALFVMSAQTAAAAVSNSIQLTQLTPAQKSGAVISLLMSKKTTPQQKVIICKAVLQGVSNVTSPSPTANHSIAMDIAAFVWLKIYNATCANVTGAVTMPK